MDWIGLGMEQLMLLINNFLAKLELKVLAKKAG